MNTFPSNPMRIRRSTPSPSPSLSSCSSSSSCFSSSPHSAISSHSLTSSSNSTSSLFSLPPTRRCEGLDLLVKAVYHVAGSVVGVPYIQRRIIRRRKPAVRFSSFLIGLEKRERENDGEDKGEMLDSNSQMQKKKKQKRRSMAIPSKYQNSVLQSWKPIDCPRTRSSKIEV